MSANQPDLGRLLRVRAMVIGAAQVEATEGAALALVRAYAGLREEMLHVLESEALGPLRDEFERLFTTMEEPEPFHPYRGAVGHAELASAASEAQVNLLKIQGWIQGLVDELTLEQRLRLEAEEKAKLESKFKPGFGS
jgi:hypothetical protein